MTRTRNTRRISAAKLLTSLVAVSLVGLVGVVGTRAALSATTDNTSNQFNAGEISITDNDAGSFMYNVTNALPGDTVTKCVQVTYAATPGLKSNVVLYMGTPIGSVGPYVNMTVDVGTQASPVFPDCTGFAPVTNLYTGTLGGFQSAHSTAGTGLAYSPNGATPWASGDTAVYRVTLTLSNTARAPGENFSGTHIYTWRADSV